MELSYFNHVSRLLFWFYLLNDFVLQQPISFNASHCSKTRERHKNFLSLLEIPSQNCTNGLKRFLEKKTRCLGILIKRNNYSFPANFYNPMIIVDDKVDDAGLFCQRAAFP